MDTAFEKEKRIYKKSKRNAESSLSAIQVKDMPPKLGSSLLQGTTVDKELDDLFKSSAGSLKPIASSNLGRPTAIVIPSNPPLSPSKATKRSAASVSNNSHPIMPSKRSKIEVSVAPQNGDSSSSKKSSRKYPKNKGATDSPLDDEDDPHLEDSYTPTHQLKGESSEATSKKLDVDDEEQLTDNNQPPPIHESLKKATKSRKKAKSKYVPSEETRRERDARTLFIGNLPVEAMSSKPILKSLLRLLMSNIPASAKAKVESTRFRSVPFKAPTTSKDTGDTSTATQNPAEKSSGASTKQTRQQQRAATWRQDQEEEEAGKPEKTPAVVLSSAAKKRMSFIKKEFNENAQMVNCYVVLGHHPPSTQVTEDETPLHPAKVALLIAEEMDGATFMERTLRVDVAAQGGMRGDKMQSKDNMKRTIYVGNLDFEAREEDVRAFFESLVTKERGETLGEDDGSSSEASGDDEAGSSDTDGNEGFTQKTDTTLGWVKNVRIIRDHDTQLGKGFAYVQFRDIDSVDEILALDEDSVKFAKRKLRIQRCKTLPGISRPQKAVLEPSSGDKTNRQRLKPKQPDTDLIPKGDPKLGDRLKSLSKDERKAYKSSDPDRLARRLAKKKARGALEKEGVRFSNASSATSILGKTKSRKGAKDKVSGKTRMRSDKAVLKKNVKK